MDPCSDCPLPGRCTPDLCGWFRSGEPVKRAHVLALAGQVATNDPGPDVARAAILERRSKKPRINLGERPPATAPGRR